MTLTVQLRIPFVEVKEQLQKYERRFQKIDRQFIEETKLDEKQKSILENVTNNIRSFIQMFSGSIFDNFFSIGENIIRTYTDLKKFAEMVNLSEQKGLRNKLRFAKMGIKNYLLFKKQLLIQKLSTLKSLFTSTIYNKLLNRQKPIRANFLVGATLWQKLGFAGIGRLFGSFFVLGLAIFLSVGLILALQAIIGFVKQSDTINEGWNNLKVFFAMAFPFAAVLIGQTDDLISQTGKKELEKYNQTATTLYGQESNVSATSEGAQIVTQAAIDEGTAVSASVSTFNISMGSTMGLFGQILTKLFGTFQVQTEEHKERTISEGGKLASVEDRTDKNMTITGDSIAFITGAEVGKVKTVGGADDLANAWDQFKLPEVNFGEDEDIIEEDVINYEKAIVLYFAKKFIPEKSLPERLYGETYSSLIPRMSGRQFKYETLKPGLEWLVGVLPTANEMVEKMKEKNIAPFEYYRNFFCGGVPRKQGGGLMEQTGSAIIHSKEIIMKPLTDIASKKRLNINTLNLKDREQHLRYLTREIEKFQTNELYRRQTSLL